jgi:hypothetical protein
MDGKLMAGETPKTRDYAQPRSDQFGNIYRDPAAALGMDSRIPFLGPLDQGFMGRSPRLMGLYVPDAEVPPANANPAAVRAYTRNAPYLQEFMSDPQTMMSEIMRLRQAVAESPGDVVNEYRLRILTQALGDVFGMGEKDGRAQALTTPGSR